MATGALAPLIRYVVMDGGAASPGAKAYFYASGTNTPQAVYSDIGLTTPYTQPVTADAEGVLPPIFFQALSYRVLITDANGVTIFPATDNISDFGQIFAVDLSGPNGSSLVGFINTGSGATATTVQTKLREILSLQADFGAVGDNTTDDTTAVQNWLTEVAASGKPGYAEPGRYLITSQVSVTLSNDNPFHIYGALGGSNVAPYGTRFTLGANLASNDTAAVLIDGNNQSSFCAVEQIMFSGGSHTGSGLQLKNINVRNYVRLCRFTGFAGRGLWIYAPIGLSLDSVWCDGNGRGFDLDGLTSIGEGAILSSKFQNNTTSQIDLNAGTSFVHVAGCTVYGSSTQAGVRFLANGIFGVGFYQCNFESATPAMSAGAGIGIDDLTIENCVFNPTVSAGTGYALDFGDVVRGARIQGNTFDCTPAVGATIIGLRVASASSARNTIGPNTFVNNGGGTLTNYSLPATTAISYGIAADGSAYGAVKNGATGHLLQMRGPEFDLANNGTQSLTDAPEGFVVITSAQDDAAALYYLRGSTGSSTEVSDPTGIFTNASGSATSINLYWDAGNSVYQVQNTRGGTRTITVTLLGGGF